MFWPFKRTPVVTLEEAVKDKPTPPCGNKTAHYNLTFQGAPCFKCAAIRRRENRLAEKIATRVAALAALRSMPQGEPVESARAVLEALDGAYPRENVPLGHVWRIAEFLATPPTAPVLPGDGETTSPAPEQ